MTRLLDSIGQIADQFDAIVLDQWGVLHDGSAPYPAALAALDILRDYPAKIGVLSNSGKRSAPNMARITGMGFDPDCFDALMTSGEALWQSFASGQDAAQTLFPIVGRSGDAEAWGIGLSLAMTQTVAQADAVLLMGLPDGTALDAFDEQLMVARAKELRLYCSNPDFKSPRGGGQYVISPGALAQRYQDMGGTVHLYGKPHHPIFAAMETVLNCPPERILMVGDSLHHDILGAQTAGWSSLLIRAGIHAPDIHPDTASNDIAALAKANAMPPPDFSLADLR